MFDEPVDKVDGDVQSLREKLEFKVDLDQPSVEDAPHLLSHLALKGRDFRLSHELGLGSKHVLRAVSSHLGYCHDVVHFFDVAVSQFVQLACLLEDTE